MLSKNKSIIFQVADSDQMEKLGAVMAKYVPSGSVVSLTGALGAGKTTLARGFIRALGHEGSVKSPTYNIVENYLLNQLSVYHFDWYRLQSPEELLDMGFEEYFNEQSICLIEWPEKGGDLLPAVLIHCDITHDESGRRISLDGSQPESVKIINEISENFAAKVIE